MKTLYNKYWKASTLLGILLSVSVSLFISGCGGAGDSGLLSTCNVPTEASMSSSTRIGGATTSVELLSSDGVEWTLYNIANELHATEVGVTKSTDYSVKVKGYIKDITIATGTDGTKYALLAMGDEGIAAVDVTNPAAMSLVINGVKVNYDQTGISWTEGGGDIVADNNISSKRAPITSLVVYQDANTSIPLQLIIGDSGYGIQKTALNNLFDNVNGREDDGTLKIEQEVYTLQYAGENPWGGPLSMTLYGEGNNTRLFVAQGFLGMGIYDPKTLEKVGRYNLYTDASERNRGEDWFINMNVANEVQSGNLDSCTGMPDYKQASFEILDVWHGSVIAPTPWADFDRYGKYYYNALKVDVADLGGKTIAYIAYGLGGLVAVDVTGYDTAVARDANCSNTTGFLDAKFLGYAPAAPAHGPDEETGQQSKSLFPYFGVGKLKDAGVIDVKVDVTNNKVYYTDHFTGLMVIDNADDPWTKWHGPNGFNGYNNNSQGPLGDHWPDYEFVTSYDMTPVLSGDEEIPTFVHEAPILLTTGELSGHGNALALTNTFDASTSGGVDIVTASGAGGLSFVDVVITGSQANNSYTVPVHIPTTNEIGAAPDGSATQEISIGHSEGVTAYGNLLFLADGPHGMSVWKIADDDCIPTDNVHLIANTLQSEYPVTIDENGTVDVNGTITINPVPHAYDVVLDIPSQSALVMSQSRGLRRLSFPEGATTDGPILLYPKDTDIFEHNVDSGNVVDFLHMQDHAYGVAMKGTLAFTADGSNGLTVYDLSKDPTDPTSGYVVSNIGGDTNSSPDIGRVSSVALWTNAATGKTYALTASGPKGVGVIDVTNEHNMTLVKVFEPIKMEGDKVGKADGKSVVVKVVGNYAFFTYDSFGVVSYAIADLIAPLIEGTDPTKIWVQNGLDQRPVALARFKLQDASMFGSEELAGWSGGAAGMDVVSVNGRNFFYIAYGEAGVVKIDWTNPAAPILMEHANTVGTATDVVVINGRVYVADGSGGLALLK
ncbi:MAG: hypothetical protein R3331_03490 [Sulfurospirillaceae bacterium]|nr:hypothetical protein [Sulfurospirillaceae bacterium]